MKYNFTFEQLKKLYIASLLMIGALIFGQANGPALEMTAGSGNTVANGPTTVAQTIFFQNNTDNTGAGTTFTTYAPTLSATYAISNIRSGNVINFGQTTTGAVPIFELMNAQGAPADANFTSAGAAVGTGIVGSVNRAVRLYVQTLPLRTANRPTNSTTDIADLTITFNRPVNNPVIHLGGLGGTSSTTPVLGFSALLDLTSFVGTNVSLTRLSGNGTTSFQATSTSISNGSTTFASTGVNSGSGSVRVNGTGITSLTFKIAIKGDGANTAVTAWSPNNDAAVGEAFSVGFSTLESDIQLIKTMSNTSAAVGSNVNFVVTATNNGASNNANINITDVLPTGYSMVGSPTASVGTYTGGVWNIPTLNAGASATLTMTGTVLATGNYTNTATLTSSAVPDSKSFNNTATVSRLPDSDRDGVFDNVDLDDDNDGIPDTLEKGVCGVTGSIMSMTGYKASVYDGVPGVDAWAEMNASTTFPTASFNQIATFDYNEFAATQNAFNINFDALGNLSSTNPKIFNYQGITISPTSHEYAITFTKIINADEAGTYQYTLTNADNHVFVYRNGVKVASRQNVYSSVIPVANFVTITVALGDRIDVVLVEEDLNNTYITMSATKTAGQCLRDTDGDGTPNHLDLDSDNDGCFDAIEGDENVIPGQLNADGSINTSTTGGIGTTAGTNNGIPNLVNSGGLADVGGDVGQGIGDSQSSTLNTQCIDTDGDGIPNNIDLDDDNDGILDTIECGFVCGDPFINGGFEFPVIGSTSNAFYNQSTAGLGWQTTATDDLIEIWRTGFNGVPSAEGSQFAELNATQASTLYQTFCVNSAGGTVSWSVKHRGRDGVDVAAVKFGPTVAAAQSSAAVQTMSDGNTAWGTYSGTFTIPPGYTSFVVAFQAVSTSTGNNASGNFIDDVQITLNQPCLDTDGDGIPNSLDLDSDGDGCFDAIEGDENVIASQLNPNGSINYVANGGLGNVINTNNGVPNLVNSGGTGDVGGDVGQGLGQSQDATKNDCIDSDGDTVPDWQDLDDDNDGILDLVECPNVYIVRPVVTSSITTTSTITSGNIQTIANAEGAGGTGNGAVPHWYTNAASNLPVIVNMNLQAASTIDNIKLYGPWGFNEWIKDFKIELYNSSNALLGTEYLTAPDQYAGGGIILGFSKEYLNVSSVRFTIISDQGYNTVIPRRVSLSELVFLDLQVCDTDGDGIPNRLDLDSDGDGCTDAIEGGSNFTTANLVAAIGTISTQTPNQNLGNTVGNTVTTIGVPTIAGTGQAIGQSQDGSKNDCVDTDADGIPDWQDLDDDNDGILDTVECPTTLNDFITAYSGGTTTNIVPSDFQLALNVKNQNVTRDLSAKFGYPANSGAVIVSVTNASVHPTQNVWWTKNGEQPSRWKITGTMSAYVLMGNDFLYYANDSKTIHIYDNATVIPVTVPGFANQTAVAGQWGVSETQSQKTLSNLDANSGTTENANWRYINMSIGPKSFGFSTTVAFADPNYAVVLLLECDTDKDGIPDRLDLDSDNDGCFDALEGDENVQLSQLNANGSINTTTTGGLGNVSTNLGVPNLVNSGGAADIGGDVGQGVGDSQNALINLCYCYKKPVLDAGSNVPVQHGITALTRAGGGTTEWPTIRQSAWTVLEANTKGFVVNKVAFEDADNNATTPTTPVGIPTLNYVEGMMVYDTTANCLKIYNGTFWNCYSTQTCPPEITN